MNACERHPEREGTLTVDLPSLNIRRYMCAECRGEFSASLTPYKGKREAWEAESDYTRAGDSVWYDSTRGRVQIAGFDERTWK